MGFALQPPVKTHVHTCPPPQFGLYWPPHMGRMLRSSLWNEVTSDVIR
jgi:hypothetical protein